MAMLHVGTPAIKHQQEFRKTTSLGCWQSAVGLGLGGGNVSPTCMLHLVGAPSIEQQQVFSRETLQAAMGLAPPPPLLLHKIAIKHQPELLETTSLGRWQSAVALGGENVSPMLGAPSIKQQPVLFKPLLQETLQAATALAPPPPLFLHTMSIKQQPELPDTTSLGCWQSSVGLGRGENVSPTCMLGAPSIKQQQVFSRETLEAAMALAPPPKPPPRPPPPKPAPKPPPPPPKR